MNLLDKIKVFIKVQQNSHEANALWIKNLKKQNKSLKEQKNLLYNKLNN